MHVGVAKTGTTYLQRILLAHREVLRSAGLLYPGKRAGDQYVASIDLRGRDAQKFEHLRVEGSWDRLAAEVRKHDGNAVISHETFARCSNAQIRRVIDSMGVHQVKVVLTVRDLGRQIPSVWQETLKNKATKSYDEFLTDIFVNVDAGEHKFFWKPQDISMVVRKWGRQVGMENLTIVTVPHAGAPRDELWNRFAQAIELPDVPIEMPEADANTSLGPAEAELLRYVNASLPEDFPWELYTQLIGRKLAQKRLATRASTRIVVPQAWHEAVHTRAASTVRDLANSGARVIGDLSDLSPVLSVAEGSGPDDLTRDEMVRVAAEVVRDYALTARPLNVGVALGERARGFAKSVKGRLSRAT